MVNSSRESAAKQGSMDSRKYPSCFRTIPGMNVSKVRSIHLANNGDFVYFDAASVLKAKLLEPACVGSIWSCHLSDTGRYLWWYQGVGRLSPGPRYAPPGDPLVYYPSGHTAESTPIRRSFLASCARSSLQFSFKPPCQPCGYGCMIPAPRPRLHVRAVKHFQERCRSGTPRPVSGHCGQANRRVAYTGLGIGAGSVDAATCRFPQEISTLQITSREFWSGLDWPTSCD
jgi:hypothetical protein